MAHIWQEKTKHNGMHNASGVALTPLTQYMFGGEGTPLQKNNNVHPNMTLKVRLYCSRNGHLA